jgi:hypothetical protein
VWTVAQSDWLILENPSRVADVGCQQIARGIPRTRVIAAAWKHEVVLAECPDGESARRLVAFIAEALAADAPVFDLSQIESAAGIVSIKQST